jgi:hypothetical protein
MGSLRSRFGPASVLIAMCLAVSVTTFTAPPARATLGWPQRGYDGGHSNANPREWRLGPNDVGGLRLLWSRSVRAPGSTPDSFLFEYVERPVVRSAAFASWSGQEDDRSRFTAVDPATGSKLWSRAFEATAVAATSDSVFVNANDRVTALDAGAGSRLWTRWGVQAFAASRRIGRLFVTTSDGLSAIRASDGSDVWTRSLKYGSPLLGGGLVVATRFRSGRLQMVALDARTGKNVWWTSIARTAPEMWTVAAGQGLAFVESRNGQHERVGLTAIRLTDGSVAWRRGFPGFSLSVGAVGGGRVYVTPWRCSSPAACDSGADYWPKRGRLLALEVGAGHTIWSFAGRTNTPAPLWGVGALANGIVYASSDDAPSRLRSRLSAISAASGRLLWTEELRGTLANVAAVADGRVYAVTQQGNLGGRILAFGI